MSRAFIDRTGHRYGRLTVMSFLGKPIGKTKAVWICLCDCGITTTVTSSNLATQHTESCGCLVSETSAAKRIYDKKDAAEYAVWRSVRQRTGSHSGKNHKWYAGVDMSEEWQNSFAVFLADMGKKPSPKHSIERLDCALGYCANNCVWATAEDQANNRSTNHVLTFNGKSLTLAQWGKRTGIKEQTILARIDRYKWSIEDALTKPTKGH